MPTISMFYGIIIRMRFAPGEHPLPHFHSYYAEYTATVDMRTCELKPHIRNQPTIRGYNMYPSVTSVVPKNDYILDITFCSGESGTLDMKPYLGFGIFNRLKDRRSFEKVTVAFDTIEWEVGVDLDPEFVYDKCSKAVECNKKQTAA